MDRRLFMYLWGISEKSGIVRAASVFISRVSRQVFFVLYAAAGVYLLYIDYTRLLPFLIIPFTLLFITLFLRKKIKRPRPYTELGITPLEAAKDKSSCPSNHATSSCVISAACMYVCVPLGAVMFFCTALTGLSRVFSGAHYPGDIGFGWALGLIFGSAFLFL